MVSLPEFIQSIDSRVIAAANELGGAFNYNLDMNSGNPLGTSACSFSLWKRGNLSESIIAWMQKTIGNGERSSSATSYLTTDVLNRPNLHILLNSRVIRVLPSYSSKGRPSMKKVKVVGGVLECVPVWRFPLFWLIFCDGLKRWPAYYWGEKRNYTFCGRNWISSYPPTFWHWGWEGVESCWDQTDCEPFKRRQELDRSPGL